MSALRPTNAQTKEFDKKYSLIKKSIDHSLMCERCCLRTAWSRFKASTHSSTALENSRSDGVCIGNLPAGSKWLAHCLRRSVTAQNRRSQSWVEMPGWLTRCPVFAIRRRPSSVESQIEWFMICCLTIVAAAPTALSPQEMNRRRIVRLETFVSF